VTCDKKDWSTTENRGGKHVKNRLLSGVMAYFQWYLTAESHPKKIRITFDGCHKKLHNIRRFSVAGENYTTLGGLV
jgi:hypothetical protein